jgi:hypothetical protein
VPDRALAREAGELSQSALRLPRIVAARLIRSRANRPIEALAAAPFSER